MHATLSGHTEESIAAQLEAANTRLAELQLRLAEAVEETMFARRRAEADLDLERRFAIEDMAKALLPVKDALETALAIDTSDVGAMTTGLELTHKQLVTVLNRFT